MKAATFNVQRSTLNIHSLAASNASPTSTLEVGGWKLEVAPVSSLYLHVPFCAHKCEYCAFYSAVPKEDLVGRYVSALVRELELVAPEIKPRTVFFGGGTPSLLNLKQWEQIGRAHV